MKLTRLLLVTLLTLALSPWLSVPTTAQQSTALERGYRTGYSDGYNVGFRDINDGQPRDFQNKDEYQRADRSYNQAWGPIEDYRDGYQQGFEVGYSAGYDRQSFNSTIPSDLRRRPAAGAPAEGHPTTDATVGPNPGTVFIARDSVMLVEMLSSLSTDASQRGDRFQARVLEPREYEGAIVEGRVTRVRRPGKVKGVAELQLDFEVIRFPDSRIANLNADVIEVVETSSDGVGTVDPEGGVRGKDSTKDDVSKVGAATGIGAIIGAIAGGGKGAAIGAAIGGGIGTGGVLNQRGKDIRLERGQQLRIRTATETRLEARN